MLVSTLMSPAAEVTLPAPANLHLFLLAGQSNMAGRGEVTAADQVPDERILALNARGEWVQAVDPVHWDKPDIVGVGVARSFARRYLETHPGVTVGFIPTACGGSPISTWLPNAYFEATYSFPYNDAIARTRRALTVGTLKGILWHQGESDSHPNLAPAYEGALRDLIARFRTEFGQPMLPVVIGQLGQFEAAPWGEATRIVDAAQQRIAADTPQVAFVSSNGLKSKPDNIHFNRAALIELGHRYADAFATIAE